MMHAREGKADPGLCRRAHFFKKGSSCRSNSCRRCFSPALLLCSPASAAPDAAPAARSADVLTPEQAKRALETLSDDKKRAEVIETLRAVANASQPPQVLRPRPNRNPRYRSRRTALARSFF